jgi:hypothetical protein
LLIVVGDQVPTIPFGDVVAKIGDADPEHTLGIGAKFGATIGFTVIVKVVNVAHSPAVGVKVYVVVAKLFKAGDQVPVIPLVEVVGKADKGLPEQIAGTTAKIGVIFGFTVIVNVVVVVHCPAVGVKV